MQSRVERAFSGKKKKRTGNDVFFCLMATAANGTQHTLDALFGEEEGGKETIRVWYDFAGRQHLTVQKACNYGKKRIFSPLFPRRKSLRENVVRVKRTVYRCAFVQLFNLCMQEEAWSFLQFPVSCPLSTLSRENIYYFSPVGVWEKTFTALRNFHATQNAIEK